LKKAVKKAVKKVVKKAVKPAGPGRGAHLEASTAFRDYVLAQLDALGEVTSRAMFGGFGLYRNGMFFGLIAGDVLYFKVGEANRRDFARYEAPPFRPYPDRPPSTKHFAVPLAILESEPELTAWARKALRVAAEAHSA
jgi:DNA transformation protein